MARARARRARGERFRLRFRDLSPRALGRFPSRRSRMSEHFHAHGPHDHEAEHAAHSGDPLAARVAVLTAILATIGAVFGYMAGATQNEALLYKNEAAIKRTEASDQWNFYQAKSSKQNLAEIGATLASGADAERYKSEV